MTTRSSATRGPKQGRIVETSAAIRRFDVRERGCGGFAPGGRSGDPRSFGRDARSRGENAPEVGTVRDFARTLSADPEWAGSRSRCTRRSRPATRLFKNGHWTRSVRLVQLSSASRAILVPNAQLLQGGAPCPLLFLIVRVDACRSGCN